MKFSEIKSEEWPALAPYLDTCLLPVSGLDGSESPVEAAERLERLRDVLDLLERPYRGRTVTYPAWHFVPDIGMAKLLLVETVKRLRERGFRYIVLVTVMEAFPEEDELGADLIIMPSRAEQIRELITKLWN